MSNFEDNIRKFNWIRIHNINEAFSNKDEVQKALSADKARQILHDGEVRGQKLTDQQRKFFGAIANGGDVIKACKEAYGIEKEIAADILTKAELFP